MTSHKIESKVNKNEKWGLVCNTPMPMGTIGGGSFLGTLAREVTVSAVAWLVVRDAQTRWLWHGRGIY